MCFGAKDDQFGKFVVEVGGSVKSVKLVHVSGFVRCRKNNTSASNWGCGRNNIDTILTRSDNTTLLPDSQETSYQLPGYTPNSDEIVFADLKNPLILSSGQELRIWYGEDLVNGREIDNYGTSCADVYAKYE